LEFDRFRVVQMYSRSLSFSSNTFFLPDYSKVRWVSSGRNVVEESKMFVRYDIVSECSMFYGFRGTRNSNRTRKKNIYVISTTRRTHRWFFRVCLSSNDHLLLLVGDFDLSSIYVVFHFWWNKIFIFCYTSQICIFTFVGVMHKWDLVREEKIDYFILPFV